MVEPTAAETSEAGTSEPAAAEPATTTETAATTETATTTAAVAEPVTSARPTAPQPSPSGDFLGTGRRKTSVARVRVRPGSGKIVINNRPLEEYFFGEQDRQNVMAPLLKSGKQDTVDVTIRVHGGGFTGQSGACMLGIARALIKFDVETFDPLRQNHLLTRDGRMKERKHYGLRGARRGTQFSKR